jgi:hypothetical protein
MDPIKSRPSSHRRHQNGETVNFRRFALAPLALSFLFAFSVQSGPALAQMTPEEEAVYKAMMQQSMGADADANMGAAEASRKQVESSRRWTEGKGIVHYHIVGEYQARTNVVGGGGAIGYGDVTDRVVIDLDWKLSAAQLVGTPVIQNAKSTVKNLRDYEPKCLPPILNGEYEHYQLLSLKPGLSGQLEAQVVTTYPPVQVVQFCTGKRKVVPAARDERPEEFLIHSPVMLTMALPDSEELSVSPDKKSLIVKKDGWTWTYTPSVKK